MKKLLSYILLALPLLSLGASIARADSTAALTLTPVVIDEKGNPRDIFNETLTLTNTSSHTLDLYPSVNNVNPAAGEQQFAPAHNADDLSASLANWIELSRGVIQLGPGEVRTIPFVIRLNNNAAPGQYHAQISFNEGETRDAAAQRAPVGSVNVNLEVQANIIQLLQLDKFATGNIFFSGDDVLFKYSLENIGNQSLQPNGEIRVYNRQGEEVASVPVNKEGDSISPSQVSQLASVWSAAKGFGRYKALLTVDYGPNQAALVQDTVFFWIIPWQQLLGMATITMLIIIGLTFYFNRWLEQRHLLKLAHAGKLHPDAMREFAPPPPPPAPVARLISSAPVSAQAHDERRRFGLFKRRTASHASHAHTTPMHHAPSHRSLREVLNKDAVHAPHHHTGAAIDLKQLRARKEGAAAVAAPLEAPREPKAHVQGHVISLKKRP